MVGSFPLRVGALLPAIARRTRNLSNSVTGTKVDEQPVMFERPMDGEALRRQIHRSLSVISPGRRKTKQLELQRMEEYGMCMRASKVCDGNKTYLMC